MGQIKSSKELKSIAKERLLGHYSVFVFSYVIMNCIYSLILNLVDMQSGSQSLIYWTTYLILTILLGVFCVGQYRMYSQLLRGNKIAVKDMWYGFRNHADKAILIQIILFGYYLLAAVPLFITLLLYSMTHIFQLIIIIALAVIIFIVASVYITVSYAQALFLLIDYPDESAIELMKHSNRIMHGHKFQMFYIYASFIGIMLLVLLTFGIGMLWAYPYITCTRTLFYEELLAQEPVDHIDIVINEQEQPPYDL